MINEDKGDVAIFSLADDVLIERNRLVIVPFRGGGDGGGGDGGGGDDEDDCECDDKLILYRRHDHFRDFVTETINKASRDFFTANNLGGYKAKGGIQIGTGSTKVIVLRNEIFGGAGHGIILGHRAVAIILSLEPAGVSGGAISTQPAPPVNSMFISEVDRNVLWPNIQLRNAFICFSKPENCPPYSAGTGARPKKCNTDI